MNASTNPPQYEAGDHIQIASDPRKFGVVMHGFREATSGRSPHTGRPSYKPTPESLAQYGYALLVKWGAFAFETDYMDTVERSAHIHVKYLAPASTETSALLTQLLDPTGWNNAGPDKWGHALCVATHRLWELRRASKGPLRPRGYFPSQDSHRAMSDCEARGWLNRVMRASAVTFEITDAGRDVVARLDLARNVQCQDAPSAASGDAP